MAGSENCFAEFKCEGEAGEGEGARKAISLKIMHQLIANDCPKVQFGGQLEHVLDITKHQKY